MLLQNHMHTYILQFYLLYINNELNSILPCCTKCNYNIRTSNFLLFLFLLKQVNNSVLLQIGSQGDPHGRFQWGGWMAGYQEQVKHHYCQRQPPILHNCNRGLINLICQSKTLSLSQVNTISTQINAPLITVQIALTGTYILILGCHDQYLPGLIRKISQMFSHQCNNLSNNLQNKKNEKSKDQCQV